LQLDADFAATTDVSFEWTPAAGLSCTDCPNPDITPTLRVLPLTHLQ